jgi:UTP--glucose-1-phosphate uridylyltransferase
VKGVVEKAVIPAAGLGSRMLPVTKSVPKEMLPVGRKPMIHWVFEEAVASGIKQVCIVIREGKEIIRDYFCSPYAYHLKRDVNIERLENLMARCEIRFIYQRRPLGLGDALLQARDFVGGDPFVMLIPDQLMRSHVPATRQLLAHWQPGEVIWSSMIKVPKREVQFFVGARGFAFQPAARAGEYRIERLLTEAETRRQFERCDDEVRGFGRTIYPAKIFDYLGEEFVNAETGEVDLLKTFESWAADGMETRGVLLAGAAFDLGTFRSYYYYLPKLAGEMSH